MRVHMTLVALLLFAFALRLINLTFQPLWFDEGWSVWFATSDLPAMVARTAADIHPPLYYALLHGWIALAGPSEGTLRLFCVLIGVLTVAALYRLAADLFGVKVALLAAMLLAVSPLHVFYSQEIRMYELVTLLGIVSTWLFWRLTELVIPSETMTVGTTAKYSVAYVLVTSAAMYTQYYGAFIPLFHFIFLLLYGRSRRALLFPLICLISLFVLYVPWLLFATAQLTQYVAEKVNIEQYTPLAPLDYLLRHLSAFAVGHLPSDTGWLAWATVVFVASALVGVVSHASRFILRQAAPPESPCSPGGDSLDGDRWGAGGRRFTYLFLYLFVPLLAGFLIQLRFPFAPPRMERLLLLASAPFLILVANGLVNFRSQTRLVALIVVVVLVGSSVISLSSFYTLPRYPEQDYRPLAHRINALALPDDVVMLVHPWQVGFLQAYLTVPVALQWVAEPDWGQADQRQLQAVLTAQQRVWLPAYYALGGILESAMEKFLTTNAMPIEAKWFVKTRLSFYAPARTFTCGAAEPFTWCGGGASDSRFFLNVAIDTRPRMAGWGSVPLELFWHPRTQLEPVKFSLRLYDLSGRLWHSQEREPLLGLWPTDQWPASVTNAEQRSDGFVTIHDRHAFLIPAGTPPGQYGVWMVVYRARDGQALGAATRLGVIEVTRPLVPPSVSALSIGTTLYGDWERVRLLGYNLRDGVFKTGESLHLDLFWQARENVNEDEMLFVQLQDMSGKPFVINEAPPLYSTSQWHRGDLIREQRDLLLPATLDAGRYRLVVGWLRASDRARLRLTGGGDQVVLREAEVVVRPHQFEAPSAQAAHSIRFGELAKLVGYDFPPMLDQSLTVRLYWQVLRETNIAYSVFVHITAADGKTIIAQHDGPPVRGAAPTTSWVSSEYISDEHKIDLPPNLRPGRYRVRVGLYDPKTGVRLKAFSEAGDEFPDDAVELFQFELK